MARKTKFQLQTGMLPTGIKLLQDGTLTGVAKYENLNIAPTWITPAGKLGVYQTRSEVSLDPLEAIPAEGRTIESIFVQATDGTSGLPWGLTLDPENGVISGSLADLVDPTAGEWLDEESPVWTTPAGSLGSFGEMEAPDITLSASPVVGTTVNYFVKNGYLPWGLTLDFETGKIKNPAAELKGDVPIEPEGSGIPPLWNTPRGSLGLYGEMENVQINLAATPTAGRAVNYFVTKGYLPWGLMLDLATGVISGTTSEIKTLVPAEYITSNGPVFGSVIVNGQPVVPNQSGNLGSLSKSSSHTLEFRVTAQMGRSLVSTFIDWKVGLPGSNNSLPWGMQYLSPSHTLTGTPADIIVPGSEYTFTVCALDSANVISSKTFKVTITA